MKMKKVFAAALASVLTLAAGIVPQKLGTEMVIETEMKVSAESVEYNGITYTKGSQSASVSSWDSDSDSFPSSVEIPSTIDGLPVVRIFNRALEWCTATRLSIPDTVIEIGQDAFKGADFVSIDIPDSVTKMDNNALSGCNASNITLGENVKYANLSDCKNLSCVTVKNPTCSITMDKNYNGTIAGYESSSAHIYAKQHGNNFISIGIFSPDDNALDDYPTPSFWLSSAEGRPGDIVTINFNVNTEKLFNAIDVVINWEDGLKAVEATGTGCYLFSTSASICASTFLAGWSSGTFSSIQFQIPENAKPGKKYEIKIKKLTTFGDDYDDFTSGLPLYNGIITVRGEKGDANRDGKLNVRDAAYVAKMLAQGKEKELTSEADFNGDGKINVRDAAAIAKHLAAEN